MIRGSDFGGRGGGEISSNYEFPIPNSVRCFVTDFLGIVYIIFLPFTSQVIDFIINDSPQVSQRSAVRGRKKVSMCKKQGKSADIVYRENESQNTKTWYVCRCIDRRNIIAYAY